MTLLCWRVEYFDSRDDASPSRIGHVFAHSEIEAGHFVSESMYNHERADLVLTVPGPHNPKGDKGLFI